MTDLETLEAELAEVTLAITHILKGGQEYTITTASGSGSSRVYKGADLATLKEMKRELQGQIATLENKAAFKIRAAW